MEAATSTPGVDQNGAGPEVPLEGEGEEQEIREEVVLEGDGQLTLAVGGKKPTNSKVVLRGGQIPFNGQAMKGDYVTLSVRARVGEIHVIDKKDSASGDIVETTRKHVLKVEGVSLVEEN